MTADNGAKAPTSTTPMGNTPDIDVAPLSTGINPNIHDKLKDFPDQRHRINEHLAKKQTQSGHARS